jgi:hypothetical protein
MQNAALRIHSVLERYLPDAFVDLACAVLVKPNKAKLRRKSHCVNLKKFQSDFSD